MPWGQKITCNDHDPDCMTYRKGKNKTANISVENCSLYMC